MRVAILLVLGVLAGCAVEHPETVGVPVAPPRRPRIDGNTGAVSDADIRTVLALMRARDRQRSLRAIPIYRIHIIDHNTMSIHYWIAGSDLFTYARRVKGRWRIDYADTERVIITGNEIPTG